MPKEDSHSLTQLTAITPTGGGIPASGGLPLCWVSPAHGGGVGGQGAWQKGGSCLSYHSLSLPLEKQHCRHAAGPPGGAVRRGGRGLRTVEDASSERIDRPPRLVLPSRRLRRRGKGHGDYAEGVSTSRRPIRRPRSRRLRRSTHSPSVSQWSRLCLRSVTRSTSVAPPAAAEAA